MNFKDIFKLTRFKTLFFLIFSVFFQIFWFQSGMTKHLVPCGEDVCLVSYNLLDQIKNWVINTLGFSLFLIFIILIFSLIYYFFKKK